MSDPVINLYSFQGLDGIEAEEHEALGHLIVRHDGTITWDQLQAVKNEVWGPDVRAIEVYPVQGDVVNAGNMRHLWRLGGGDFCPDMLRHNPPMPADETDSLCARHGAAWAEAEEVFG